MSTGFATPEPFPGKRTIPFRPVIDVEVLRGHPGISGHGVAQGVEWVDAIVAGPGAPTSQGTCKHPSIA